MSWQREGYSVQWKHLRNASLLGFAELHCIIIGIGIPTWTESVHCIKLSTAETHFEVDLPLGSGGGDALGSSNNGNGVSGDGDEDEHAQGRSRHTY